MKRNMNRWLHDLQASTAKKPLPLLAFPCTSLLGVTVRELLASSDLQAAGMQAVAARTDAAAAVSFMDLSVEAECFGAAVHVTEDEVPTVVGRLINDMAQAEALAVPTVGSGRTGRCIEAVKTAAATITDRPVLAGIIGPFSLAARLLDVSEIMLDCYDDPDMVHTVLQKATDFLIAYANAYKAAGANGVVMAEPVAGLLSPSLESAFSAPYVKQIVEAVQDEEFLLIYHNCGDNTPHMVDSLLSFKAAAYHFGNAVDMRDMLAKFPSDIPVMGNIDPAVVMRLGTPTDVRAATHTLMEQCAAHANFIPSTGCDLPPLTPWENIDAFFEAVGDCYAH